MQWLFVAAIGIVTWLLHEGRRRKVFVSYCHPEQAKYRDLLKAWHANPAFSFEFTLGSPTETIGGDDSMVRAELRNRMKGVDCLLVLVGPETYGRDWVEWEVRTAVELGIKLVAVKLDKSAPGPDSLYGNDAVWVYGFEEAKIVQALKKT